MCINVIVVIASIMVSLMTTKLLFCENTLGVK